MKSPQFSAKFAPGVKYLRHKNGIVYPYLAVLASDPNYSVVEFKKAVEIQARPLGYTPPERVEEEVKEEKKEVEKISELAGAMNQELLNPPLPEAAKTAIKPAEVTAQLLSGLEGAGE